MNNPETSVTLVTHNTQNEDKQNKIRMDNPETSVTLVTHNTQNEDKQSKNKNGQPRDIGNISHT